jgi:hypothetical protein
VSRLKPILAILLALLWLPVTSHCRLEMIPGLEFLQCLADTPTDSDCEGDSCQSVESANYKPEDAQPVLDLPAAFLTVLVALPSLESAPIQQPDWQATAPPELPSSWQFFFRAALPLRAPPFAS